MPIESYSDDFVFDNQMLCCAIAAGFNVGEIFVPDTLLRRSQFHQLSSQRRIWPWLPAARLAKQPLAPLPQTTTLCPLCQGTNAVHFLRARDHASGDWFDLNQCPNCGLIFLADVHADIGRYYHAYYRRYQPWIQQIFRILYRAHARKWARDMGRKGRALEIGCGEGWMLAALRDGGWRPSAWNAPPRQPNSPGAYRA